MTAYTRVLMCHAPIVIKEIAGDNFPMVKKTHSAMQLAAEYFVSQKPDIAIVVSPHTPRLADQFVVINSERLTGSFAEFGHSELPVDLPNAKSDIAKLAQEVSAQGATLNANYAPRLDHGALVPLHFLVEAGWQGKTMVVGFPHQFDLGAAISLGRAIQAFIKKTGQHVGLVASGDMSHRLRPGAPAGYSPQARQFDRYIVDALAKGDLGGAVAVDDRLRDEAAEDIIDSLAVCYGLDSSMKGDFYSYEGPFGVGYAVAVL